MEIRYTPGDGILVARAGRWLLLGRAGPPTAVVDQLWEDLGRPSARTLALATVQRHLDGVPLAWLDAATGDTLAASGGVVEHHGDRYQLSLGTQHQAASLRLVEGVVAASSVQVTGPVLPTADLPVDLPVDLSVDLSGDVRSRAGGVIDGIPPEILGSAPPPGPAADDVISETASEPEAEPRTVRRTLVGPPGGAGDPDHDHHTRMRSRAAADPMGQTSGHLEQSTSDTVLAVRCGRGHLTDPLAEVCRGCGEPLLPQEPQRVLRPQLGVLELPGGDVVALDRPVVFGRRPSPSGPGDWPHLVTLPHDSTYLSRRHLRIDLDGWHVLAEDLASRGGTTVVAPGRDPEMIRPHEPYLLEHGTILDLAGAYRLTYLATVPAPAEEAR